MTTPMPRLAWLRRTQRPNIEPVALTRDIGLYDKVELLEPVEKIPVGATGAVLEFHDDGKVAMVEFTSMPPQLLLDRIEFVPVSKLRVMKPPATTADARGA